MAGVSYSPNDIDLLTRVVAAEAQGEPDDGQAGVAHVVLNRLASGNYGNSVEKVVMAPGQFEPTATASSPFYSMRSGDPAYKHANQIVQGVLSGDAPDPTNGATNFYAPVAQAAMGRQPPLWAKGNPLAVIGGHHFYAPNGPVDRGQITAANQPPQADNVANLGSTDLPAMAYAPVTTGAPMAAQSPTAPAPDDFASKWGVDPKALTAPPAAAAPSTTPPTTVPSAPSQDFNAKWGIDPQALTPASEPSPIPVPPAGYGSDGQPIRGAAGVVNAAASGAASGLPIVGPAIDAGMDKGLAAVRALTGDQNFSDALASVKATKASDIAAHPIANTVGSLAGGTAGYGALAAIPGAPSLLGMSGSTMLGRMGMGAMSNALIGGADAAARSGNALMGAVVGGAGGAAAGPVGSAVGSGLNKLTVGIRNSLPTGIPGMSRATANIANTMIDADGRQNVFNAIAQHGPEATLADAGPANTGVAAALGQLPGESRSIIENHLVNRQAGSADRVQSAIHDVVGPYGGLNNVDPETVSAGIAATRTAQDTANYGAVHAQNIPVDAQPVVDLIDRQLQTATGNQRTALQGLRNELVHTPSIPATETSEAVPAVLHTNSELLHNVRKDIDGMINYGTPGLGVPQGAVQGKQGALQTVRGALDGVLKDQVPGMAEADAISAGLARRQAAVQDGTNAIFGANIPHPQTFEATREANDLGTNLAMNKGMAGKIERAFGTGTQRSTVTLNKLLAGGEDGFGAQNMAAAFGQEPTSNLLNRLMTEKAFDATTNRVVNNSNTAKNLLGAEMLKETQPGSLNLSSSNPTGLALQGAKALVVNPIIRAIMENPTAPRNIELANLYSMGGAQRDQAIQRLGRLSGAQNSVSSLGQYLQNIGTAGANRLMLSGSGTNHPSAQ